MIEGPVTDATDANDTTDELRAYAELEIAFISRRVAKAAGSSVLGAIDPNTAISIRSNPARWR